MTPAERGALILDTLTLLRDHGDVLSDDAQRLAQARALAQASALVEELPLTPDGVLVLRGKAAVVFCNVLVDCVGWLRRAAEASPRLAPVRGVLEARQDRLIALRDRAITAGLRRGPSRRPDQRRRNGWNPPDPHA